jgi:ketopantoate reductase
MDNALWEPYYDAEKGTSVRVNRFHRFTRVIYENNPNNGTLQTLIGLLLLQLAGAEIHLQRQLIKHNREEIAAILENYRKVSSDFLTKMCRDLEDSLPSE